MFRYDTLLRDAHGGLSKFYPLLSCARTDNLYTVYINRLFFFCGFDNTTSCRECHS
eukprot:COSAG02_NODE_65576_length_257_cov_1.639241_1_plen_55_part_10